VDGNLSTVQLAVATDGDGHALRHGDISAGGNGTNSLTLSASSRHHTTLASLSYQARSTTTGGHLTVTSRDSNAVTDVTRCDRGAASMMRR